MLSGIVLPQRSDLQNSLRPGLHETAIVPYRAAGIDDLTALEIEFGLAPANRPVFATPLALMDSVPAPVDVASPVATTEPETDIDLELFAFAQDIKASKQKLPTPRKIASTPDDVRRMEAAHAPLPAGPARLARTCKSAPRKRSDAVSTPKKILVATKQTLSTPIKAAAVAKQVREKPVKKSHRRGEVSMSVKCCCSRAFHGAERAARSEGQPEEVVFARRRLAYQTAKAEWKSLYG